MKQEKVLPTFELYTIKELASILEVTPRTINNYVAQGRIKGQKIAGKWKFTREELERFIKGE